MGLFYRDEKESREYFKEYFYQTTTSIENPITENTEVFTIRELDPNNKYFEIDGKMVSKNVDGIRNLIEISGKGTKSRRILYVP